MDENNGVFATGQGYPAGQAAGISQQQYQQQAPMISAQDAYSSQGFIAPEQAWGFASNVTLTQSPSSNYNPGLQQDFQASNSMDAPWLAPQYAQPTQAPVAQSSLASFDAFAQQDAQKVPISTDAYSILAEPADFNLAETSPGAGDKKILFVVIGLIVFLMLLGGTGFGAYTVGYQSGETAGKKLAQNSPDLSSDTDKEPKPEDEPEPETPEVEEPKLTFELTKPTFEEQTLSGVLGEQLKLSDGLVLNVYNVDSKYTPESTDGNSDVQYVKVDIALGNSDNARSKTISSAPFKLMDEAGDVADAVDVKVLGLDLDNFVTLRPGMKTRFSVVFEVESFSPASQLIWSQLYQVGGQSRTVSVQVALTNSSSSNKTILR